MTRCRICRLPQGEHGPARDGLVYADIFGWHTFTEDYASLTGAPPPYRFPEGCPGPILRAAVEDHFGERSLHTRFTPHEVDPDALALYFGADVARQVHEVRTSPLLPHRVPGASLTETPAPPAARPWWRRLLGRNR